VITNFGLWEITTDNTFQHYTGLEPSQFVNLGTLRKSAGTGTTPFNGINFANSADGIIEPQVGTLALPGAYVHSQGTVRLSGGTIAAGPSLAFSGGTLEGYGTVRGAGATNLLLTPGTNGPGTISFTAGLNLASSSTVRLEATGSGAGQFDQLAVTGPVNLGGSTLQITSLPVLPVGTALTVISNDGADPVEGTFKDLADGALFDNSRQLFRIYYTRGTGNDVVLVRDDGGVRLTGLGMDTNGFFDLKGLGTNYATYSIEASTDFTNWVTLGTSTADPSGLFFYFDTNAFQFPMRFYRSLGP
jgi:hypothetical protein